MYPSARTESTQYNLPPFLAYQASSLAKKGYNPAEAQNLNRITSKEVRKKTLESNLATMVNHVFEDSAVSFTNYYQMNNKGEVISYPDSEVLHIDPDERGGLNEFGIKSAVTGALENPDKVVLLYSPPGPVVFDDNPHNKFKDIKPYTDGQLYVMYSDGEKVNNVAISISGEGEKWISQIMPHEYREASSRVSAIEKVKYYITHPLLTGKSIDAFLTSRWGSQDKVIFKNKDGIEFSLLQTLSLIHQSLAGQMQQSHIVDRVLQHFDMENISMHDIDRIYGALAQHYMKENKLETMTLGGSCGGTEIKLDIFSQGLESLSTNFRMITQGENILKVSRDFRDDPNLCRCSAASGPHFHCPGENKKTKKPCSHAIEVGKDITACPSCGIGKTC